MNDQSVLLTRQDISIFSMELHLPAGSSLNLRYSMERVVTRGF